MAPPIQNPYAATRRAAPSHAKDAEAPAKMNDLSKPPMNQENQSQQQQQQQQLQSQQQQQQQLQSLPTIKTAARPPAMPTAPVPLIRRPVDKKAKLKQDIQSLRRMNQAKKLQLEQEKKRQKKEKRLRKQEALGKEQCERDGMDYVVAPTTTTATTTTTTTTSTALSLAISPFESLAASTESDGDDHHVQQSRMVSMSPIVRQSNKNLVQQHRQLPSDLTTTSSTASTDAANTGPASNNAYYPGGAIAPRQQSAMGNATMYSSSQPPMFDIQQQQHPYGMYSLQQPQPWMQQYPYYVDPQYHAMMQQQQQQSTAYSQGPAWASVWEPLPIEAQAPAAFPTFTASQPLDMANASLTKMPFPSVAVIQATSTILEPPASQPPRFSNDLLKAPSPYAASHYMLPHTITIVKGPTDASFGVTLKIKATTVLVDATQGAVNEGKSDAPLAARTTPDKANVKSAPSKVEKNFVILSVERLESQISRHGPTQSPDALLQTDDLVLAINDQTTAGLTFAEAVTLIKNSATVNAQGSTTCQLTVARRKLATPLTSIEMGAFASCMIKAMFHSKRVLGSSDVADDDLVLDSMLQSRNLDQLRLEWERMRAHLQIAMTEQAAEHWKLAWSKESPEIQKLGVNYMTDAQRSALRLNIKPAKGCRCGATNHEYVYDTKCPLYSNLRHLSKHPTSDPVLSKEEEVKRLKATLLSYKDLNTVEKGFKDRFVREQVDKKLDQKEAEFIVEMEEIQVKELQQAVRAPCLTAMVLSAAIEVCPEFLQSPAPTCDLFVQSKPQDSPPCLPSDGVANDFPDDDDDDDDVPLVQLAMSPQNKSNVAVAAEDEKCPYIRPKFLAKLLHTISLKWGHLYRELGHNDFIWRWELFHGENTRGSNSWKSYALNPRMPDLLSLENLRFVVNDKLISSLESDQLDERSRALNLVSMAISPAICGVADELQALCKSGVLRMDDGIPVPPNDWWAKVDLVLLEDMHERWGTQSDPRGLHGISNKMRKLLGRKWQRTPLGWSMSDNSKRIIYDLDDYSEWRRALDDKQQSQTNHQQGVGRFGI